MTRKQPTRLVVWLGLLLLCGLLLFAAVMKLLKGGTADVAIASTEICIVLIALYWRNAWQTWAFFATLFGAFAGHTLYLYAGGSSTCGCFGNLAVPPRVTLAVDFVSLAAALLVLTLSFHATGRVCLAVSISGLGGSFGMAQAFLTSPPSSSLYAPDEVQMLLESTAYFDLAESQDIVWYLYLFDPDCPVCRRHLPLMRRLENTTREDAAFRVRTLNIFEIEAETGIPYWAWGATPIMIVLHNGAVTDRQSGFDYLDPEEVSARVVGTTARDPLLRIFDVQEIADLSSRFPQDSIVVYLYDGTRSDTAMLKTYESAHRAIPPSTGLHIVTLSFEAIARETGLAPEMLIEAGEAALLLQRNEIVNLWQGDEVPDPVELWSKLQSGVFVAPGE